MRQTAKILSTYAADTSGVCSALFELGGMTVIHDAGGCNSTYATHDEPRWYDRDSMVFVSMLTEMQAVMGDDEKLIGDTVATALELHPRFVALTGTPIPNVTGFDFAAAARVIESRTGIPSFGFPANGMNSYLSGVSMALEGIVRRFSGKTAAAAKSGGAKSDGAEPCGASHECGERPIPVNILGATPLDFSTNGTVGSIKSFLAGEGFSVTLCLAMDDGLDSVGRAGDAAVNLVVSESGLASARALREKYGIPYCEGVPTGVCRAELADSLRAAARTGEDKKPFAAGEPDAGAVVIGERIYSQSLARALTGRGIAARALCPIGFAGRRPVDEEELPAMLVGAKLIVADPMFRPVAPLGAKFVPLPHEAFSGRLYRKDIPDLVGGNIDILFS